VVRAEVLSGREAAERITDQADEVVAAVDAHRVPDDRLADLRTVFELA